MKKFDVAALGEILIDFTSAGVSTSGQALYERNPGGAPANVSVAVSRLGGAASFIGKVGRDSFGVFLKDALCSTGVETRGMRVSDAQHTTLAFVSLDDHGERNFSFCRNPGADTQLEPAELDAELLRDSLFLHVGSLSLVCEPVLSTTFEAIRIVKESGGYVSYDPNWRAPLWTDQAIGVSAMKSLLPYADLVKVSDEELTLLFGSTSLSEGAGEILSAGPRLVLVTLGARGVFFRNSFGEGFVPALPANVVDTTGAGDSFVGGLLYRLSRRGETDPLALSIVELEKSLLFANAVASLCVMKRGAIPAMPTLAEVEALLSR